MNPFSWRMCLREMRGTAGRFVFFTICIALGVGSLVGVGNVSMNVNHMIRKEAKNLLAADLEVRVNQPLPESLLQEIKEIKTPHIRVARVTELTAMAADPKTGISQLIELKAAEPGYPFYGALETDPPLPPSSLTGIAGLTSKEIFVQEPFLHRVQVKVGDPIKIGENTFIIKGILRKEPDRIAGTFSFGPRGLITQTGLEETKLLQPGSRIRYRYLIKIPDRLPLLEAQEKISEIVKDKSATVRSYQSTQPSIARFLNRLGTYLGMIGLITLIVGGIGVANGIRVFLKQKIQTIAILKCLGGDSKTILGIYWMQVLLLGLAGSFMGILFGLGVSEILERTLESVMKTPLSFTPRIEPLFRGFAMGLLTTILFTLWPLLGVTKMTPQVLFRNPVEEQQSFTNHWKTWIMLFIFSVGLFLLAVWQANSVKLGLLFIGTMVGAFFLLRAGSWTLLRILRALPRSKFLALRQAVSNLSRPGNQTHTIIFSIGLGVTIILAVHMVQLSLMMEIKNNLPFDAPSLFFIDIQPDQKEGMETLFANEQSMVTSEIIPIVRTRIHSIDGKTVEEIDKEQETNWYFKREYVVTYQTELPKHNSLEKGTWWNGEASTDQPLLSVEKEAANGLGIGLGSTLEFDIQGVKVPATVSSIREVDWGSMTTNFYMIFSPASLKDVPLNYIGTARLPKIGELKLQNAVVKSFPNITTINLRDILETVSGMLNQMNRVIRFMAAFSIGAGLIVLSSALSATRLQRIRETIIMKTLGATRPLILASFSIEYALLGAIAGTIGVGLSILVGWMTVHYILQLTWHFSPATIVQGLLLTVLLTVTTGWITTYRILGQKPLSILNSE